MEPLLLQVFQHQVLTQCEFMLLAAEDVQAALQAHDTTRVFYGLQNLLNAAANVSKALWGQRGKRAAQRQELRASLGIALLHQREDHLLVETGLTLSRVAVHPQVTGLEAVAKKVGK